jgi:hypothetical protein
METYLNYHNLFIYDTFSLPSKLIYTVRVSILSQSVKLNVSPDSFHLIITT